MTLGFPKMRWVPSGPTDMQGLQGGAFTETPKWPGQRHLPAFATLFVSYGPAKNSSCSPMDRQVGFVSMHLTRTCRKERRHCNGDLYENSWTQNLWAYCHNSSNFCVALTMLP